MTIQLFEEASKSVCIGRPENRKVLDHVPARVYSFLVMEQPFDPPHYHLLYRSDTLPVPQQRYGDHSKMVAALVESYDRLNPPVGAICVGLKGSGKTVLCNDICNSMIKAGLPVVLIEGPIGVDHLRNIMAITGPCVMFFDEFGKHYTGDDERNKLLSLFSDASLNGYMFLLTANSICELSNFVIDRPGRFAWRFEMDQVDTAALQDFFVQNSIPKERLMWLGSIRSALSFDVLLALKVALRNSKSFVEFRKATRWMNVPNLTTSVITIQGAAWDVSGSQDIKIEKLSGEIVGDKIQFKFLRDGEPDTDEMDLLDANGFLNFDRGVRFKTSKLILNLHDYMIRTADSMLAEGTPFYRFIEPGGMVQSLSSRFEDTASATYDPTPAQVLPPARKRSAEGAGREQDHGGDSGGAERLVTVHDQESVSGSAISSGLGELGQGGQAIGGTFRIPSGGISGQATKHFDGTDEQANQALLSSKHLDWQAGEVGNLGKTDFTVDFNHRADPPPPAP